MRTTQPTNPQTGQPLATFSLDVVAKFPILTRAVFGTIYRERLPEFDYTKPIKRWRDEQANPAGGREYFVYKVATTLAGGFKADKDGFVEPIDTGMSAAEAWAVNIPPDIGLGTIPGTTPTSEVRMPIELLPNERLQQAPFGGVLRVRNLSVPDAPSGGILPGSFTEADRRMLTEIYLRGK